MSTGSAPTETRRLVHCHPEERSDEGSAPQIVNGREQILRIGQDDKRGPRSRCASVGGRSGSRRWRRLETLGCSGSRLLQRVAQAPRAAVTSSHRTIDRDRGGYVAAGNELNARVYQWISAGRVDIFPAADAGLQDLSGFERRLPLEVTLADRGANLDFPVTPLRLQGRRSVPGPQDAPSPKPRARDGSIQLKRPHRRQSSRSLPIPTGSVAVVPRPL